MLKIAFILVLAACVYGVQCRQCDRLCKHESKKEICAADRHVKSCQRMTQCQLLRENCRRRSKNQSPLKSVAGSRCAKLKRPGGRGPCASPLRRGRRDTPVDCNRIKCTNPNPALICARTKSNMCQRLTRCQLQRRNCRRGHSDRMELTHLRRCAGMKAGQKLQHCRPVIPKRG